MMLSGTPATSESSTNQNGSLSRVRIGTVFLVLVFGAVIFVIGMTVGKNMASPSSFVDEDSAGAKSAGSTNEDLIGIESLFVEATVMPSLRPSQPVTSLQSSSPSVASSDLPSVSPSTSHISSLIHTLVSNSSAVNATNILSPTMVPIAINLVAYAEPNASTINTTSRVYSDVPSVQPTEATTNSSALLVNNSSSGASNSTEPTTINSIGMDVLSLAPTPASNVSFANATTIQSPTAFSATSSPSVINASNAPTFFQTTQLPEESFQNNFTNATRCFTTVMYDAIDTDIAELKLSISDNIERSHFLGGIVRLTAHDFMDYDRSSSTVYGADGCFDPAHEGNAGLPESVWCKTCLLRTLYEAKYTQISRADFWIASANAVIRQTSINNTLDLKEVFTWGRIDRDVCESSGDRLPTPAGCSDVERTFLDRMGLQWRDAVALMGAHSLGRGSSSVSRQT
jgi:hypothetical protein